MTAAAYGNPGQKSARARRGERRWHVGDLTLCPDGWGRKSVGRIVAFENWCGNVMVFVQFDGQPRPRWNYLHRLEPVPEARS